ncbi:hypothetical protein NDU88_008788 [Pleurodeles waltl]|uniref:Cadherin-like beta-sandwich-like domain-containing protein n=1 Tax=Pleurodeles waltl TaxID=8319 RepID=A0AAV7RZ33_PLEWA|nr:hypothetical protein NDU88_008788 [Pleurodeles waltl]
MSSMRWFKFYSVLPAKVYKQQLGIVSFFFECDNGGDGSKVVKLKDGVNTISVEVTAEDGTVKLYVIEVTKLAANAAFLQGLALTEDIQLVPPFASSVYEYTCSAPYYCSTVHMQPLVPDSKMKLAMNGTEVINSIPLSIGDTVIEVEVSSADGTKSQVYQILVTRHQLPCFISFVDIKDIMIYECPVSLTAFYRPVSIRGSDPKHVFSAPYIDILTRRSKVDPFDETPLGDNWRCQEHELDRKMTGSAVHCCYAYRGCTSILKLSDLGLHAKDCTFKPPTELDAKVVTETEWYKTTTSGANKNDSQVSHNIKERGWEKRLQQVFGDSNVGKLTREAEEQARLYKQRLPKAGDALHYEEGSSPLDALHQAAIAYASAIKLNPKDPNLHFQLGIVMEEYYYAAEIYGLKKKSEEDEPELTGAKATGKDEEILAICKLHGFHGRPTLEQQLKALDLEFHQLKDQGQSGKADYIQTLFVWKSKQAGKDVKAGALSLDETSPLMQAFLKYQDALSLNPNSWVYNLHVGRLLLLQEKHKEALMFLQTSLVQKPDQALTRFYIGIAVMEQEKEPGTRTDECVMFLQQGLENLLTQLFLPSESSQTLQAANQISLLNIQLLKGFLQLGNLLRKLPKKPSDITPTSQQVLHLVADFASKALCMCPHRGAVVQQIEWVLLEASYGLLEVLVENSSGREDWIGRRCQALSALIRLTSIPACKELLNMQEKVCQLGVIASPCSSNALYLLGLAQLAQYDNNSENAQQSLMDAKLSFSASISLENMPINGPPKQEITNQAWWQAWKAAEEAKVAKKVEQPAGKLPAPPMASSRGKGTNPSPKGAPAPAITKPTPLSTRGGSRVGIVARGAASTAPRGRGASGSTAGKNTETASAKPKLANNTSGKPVKLAPVPPAAGPAEKSVAAQPETKPTLVPVSVTGPVQVNRVSYVHRLGLARALSRTAETLTDACHLYEEVIAMAPEVHDSYIELADILVKTNPLAAVDVYCKFPLKPVQEQTFDDAFITGEIVRLLMKHEKYDDPRLPANMIANGKVLGLGGLEKYMNILEDKLKTNVLKTVYAGIHNKPVDDKELQNFFRFKGWV